MEFFSRFALTIILGMISVGCHGRSGTDYELDRSSFDAKAVTTIEQKTGIQFPKGSRGLNFYYRGSSIDPSFIAKVEIPQSEHDSLVDQLKQFENQDGGIDSPLPNKVSWWNPPQEAIDTERLYVKNNSGVVRAVLCKENEQWILYLMWVTV